MGTLFILIAVIVIALAFDFTNGFHDTANAMATSIATGALKPKSAVIISAILNLVGAFLSVEVALTVTNKVIAIQGKDGSPLPALMGMPVLEIVLAGLIGGVAWNLLTWLLGIPSSSSHALFGGLIGAAIMALGWDGVHWSNVVKSVLVPAVAAPVVAMLVSATGTFLVYAVTKNVPPKFRRGGFRWGQIFSASLVSLAHGTNDAQKTMGVITLALIGGGWWHSSQGIPFWVKVLCAVAIAAGTYSGGWRVIRTLGKGLVEIESPQGLAADMASATIILTSSHAGMALSTTHVATGSILGTGLGKRGAKVRWGVAGRMGVAWLITLPAAALVGVLCMGVAKLLPDVLGAAINILILLAIVAFVIWRANKSKIDHTNVTDEWDGESAAAAK